MTWGQFTVTHDPARGRWWLFVTLVALGLGLGLGVRPAMADTNFGNPVPGKHVYDYAGVLTPAEAADLEAKAARVEQAGAPVVVYLRAKDSNPSGTEQDARDLMD